MIQLVYASAATLPFTPDALRALLAKARSRNAMHGVTGMLLYHSGSFLQILEGPEAGVDIVLASIMRDPRHHTTRILLRTKLAHRDFEGWSMGFADTSNSLYRPAGLVDYHRELPSLPEAGSLARKYLRFFQEGLYRQGVS